MTILQQAQVLLTLISPLQNNPLVLMLLLFLGGGGGGGRGWGRFTKSNVSFVVMGLRWYKIFRGFVKFTQHYRGYNHNDLTILCYQH